MAKSDAKLELRIVTAREDACVDCLVPKEIMSQFVIDALKVGDGAVGVEDIVLTYPAEH